MTSICEYVFFAQSAHDLSWGHEDNLDLLDKVNTAIKKASSEGRFSTTVDLPESVDLNAFVEELTLRGFTVERNEKTLLGDCVKKMLRIEWHTVQPE